jgi:hypothetical protein
MSAGSIKSRGIVSWPEEERPRERLLSRGPQALTDAELVAILMRVGFRGTSAVELGRQILKRFGSLRAMVEAPVLALLDIKGLKGAKASQLVAAMEIARRVAVPRDRKQLQIKSTSAAADYLRKRLRGLTGEQFRVRTTSRSTSTPSRTSPVLTHGWKEKNSLRATSSTRSHQEITASSSQNCGKSTLSDSGPSWMWPWPRRDRRSKHQA